MVVEEGPPIGFSGARTGALVAAPARSDVAAIVSRGGRPEMAGDALGIITSPTLLIVGGHDPDVLILNQAPQRELRCDNRLEVVS
jgi:putative phosphoribosyl transferase